MEVKKCMSKKEVFLLFPVLDPLCPSLPALHLLMERLPLHIYKQLAKHHQNLREKWLQDF